MDRPTDIARNSRGPVEIAARAPLLWRLPAVAVLAFALGWAASVAWSATAPLRLVDHVTGTVSVVNQDGAKFCFEPAGGGSQRCGVSYQRQDAPKVKVGDRVSLAVGLVRRADGSQQEIFVIEAIE